jgi:hypothetical protein
VKPGWVKSFEILQIDNDLTDTIRTLFAFIDYFLNVLAQKAHIRK